MAAEDKWISIVQDLIAVNRASHDGFRQAAENAQDPDLRTFFNDESQERGSFADELETQLALLGQHAGKPSSSTTGAPHRTRAGLKSALNGGDESILISVESGEEAARKSYERALQQTLPPDLEQTLRSQFESIVAACDYVRLMRDRKKAA